MADRACWGQQVEGVCLKRNMCLLSNTSPVCRPATQFPTTICPELREDDRSGVEAGGTWAELGVLEPGGLAGEQGTSGGTETQKRLHRDEGVGEAHCRDFLKAPLQKEPEARGPPVHPSLHQRLPSFLLRKLASLHCPPQSERMRVHGR